MILKTLYSKIKINKKNFCLIYWKYWHCGSHEKYNLLKIVKCETRFLNIINYTVAKSSNETWKIK